MRAYNNSRKEVLGTITLEHTIGPMVKKVDFQVFNIASFFNMLIGRPWIHDIEAVPSSLYQKVRFPHERAIVTIYRDTLTVPKPVYGIDSKKKPLTLDGFEIEKPGFEKKEEEVEKIPMDFAPYGNINVVAMMRRMNYLVWKESNSITLFGSFLRNEGEGTTSNPSFLIPQNWRDLEGE